MFGEAVIAMQLARDGNCPDFSPFVHDMLENRPARRFARKSPVCNQEQMTVDLEENAPRGNRSRNVSEGEGRGLDDSEFRAAKE
jgi:hypothetical protein